VTDTSNVTIEVKTSDNIFINDPDFEQDSKPLFRESRKSWLRKLPGNGLFVGEPKFIVTEDDLPALSPMTDSKQPDMNNNESRRASRLSGSQNSINKLSLSGVSPQNMQGFSETRSPNKISMQKARITEYENMQRGLIKKIRKVYGGDLLEDTNINEEINEEDELLILRLENKFLISKIITDQEYKITNFDDILPSV
jgi:hypothetical protein